MPFEITAVAVGLRLHRQCRPGRLPVVMRSIDVSGERPDECQHDNAADPEIERRLQNVAWFVAYLVSKTNGTPKTSFTGAWIA